MSYVMRTLSQITDAVRRNEAVSDAELRAAIVTYDVMLAKIDVTRYPEALAEFFKASAGDPRGYYGHENSPDNPEYAAWHKEFVNVATELQSPQGPTHTWDDDGSTCVKCGDKDWMGDPTCSG